jgi:uncharacterized protein YdhG (YjbR/CyaY superfamily)
MDEGEIVIDSIEPIGFPDITPQLAQASGFLGILDLLKVAKHGKGENIYLIRFHYVPLKRKAKGRATPIDVYLSSLGDDKRAALEKLRKQIKSLVPEAEECISYQIPAFRLNGRMLVGFGVAEKHCAFYPMSGATVEAHESDLKNYDTSKGTIRFQPTKPLPAGLVRKLVKARVAENEAKNTRRR